MWQITCHFYPWNWQSRRKGCTANPSKKDFWHFKQANCQDGQLKINIFRFCKYIWVSFYINMPCSIYPLYATHRVRQALFFKSYKLIFSFGNWRISSNQEFPCFSLLLHFLFGTIITTAWILLMLCHFKCLEAFSIPPKPPFSAVERITLVWYN